MPQVYQGIEPFIFISYAHRDSASVLPIVEALQRRGFRVWYDAGIEAGAEWPEYIARRLVDSSCVIAFISGRSMESQNCRREINFAISKGKELLVVYLEDVSLSYGMQLQLDTLQALLRWRHISDDSFLDALCDCRMLQPCREGGAQWLQQNLAQLRAAAAAGDSEACFDLGYRYHLGKGLPQDPAQSVKWYRLAAEQGHDDAQCMLGIHYYYGMGVRQSKREAKKWFTLAAEQGNDTALQWLKKL